MRVCTFARRDDPMGRPRVGAVEGASVHEFEGANTMVELMTGSRLNRPPEGRAVGLGQASFLAPISRPGKIVAAIVNTAGMLGGDDVTLDRPRMDMKAPSAVVGPGDTVVGQRTGVRPEVELAAVIGKRATGLSESAAGGAIFGYTILNDVTSPLDSKEDAYEAYRRDKTTGEIRRVTMRGPLFRSKNHDTFCPTGPWIVTADELDVSDLAMSTEFEGERVQEGSTSEYLFSPAQLVSYVSKFLTLEPGDLVSCGSVGWTRDAIGNFDPTEYLLPVKEGTMRLRIEGIGELTNPLRYV